MNWQPIESGPKDGTTVLITNGHWVSEGWYSRSDWLGPQSAEGAWVDMDPRDGFVLTGDHVPTHWMPLPEPPEPASELTEIVEA